LAPAEKRVEELDKVRVGTVENMQHIALLSLSIAEHDGGIGLSLSWECEVTFEIGQIALARASLNPPVLTSISGR
jgi:acyl-CoA dehydrogenase